MSITSISDIKDHLPPCFAPMMKNAMKKLNAFWQLSGEGSWTDGYKPAGMLSGFTISSEIRNSVKLFEGALGEYTGKVASTVFTQNDFKPGISGIHQFWNQNGQTCESLAVSSSSELLIECYKGPFDGRLLSQVCNVHPESSYFDQILKAVGAGEPSYEERFSPNFASPASTSQIPTVAQGIGAIVGTFGLYKTVQALRDGSKARAAVWATMSIAAFILPNINN